MNLKNSNIIFATFSIWNAGMRMPTNGNLEPFRDFLLTKINKLILIDQPVPGSDRVLPIIETYDRKSSLKVHVHQSTWMSVLRPLLDIFNSQGTRIIFKFRDFLSVIEIGLKSNNHYNYLFGLESINCIAGLILRRLGKVDKVIYYVLDFAPNRYGNKLFNSFYLLLDKYCVRNADYVWDVSLEFQKAREEIGYGGNLSDKIIHVPIGLYPYQVVSKNKRKFNHSLVFVGTLGEENGPDLAIRALDMVNRKYPDTVLNIIGGGEENLIRLKKLVYDLELTKKVKFFGYIESDRKVTDIIKNFDIALAPYIGIKGSIRYYADSSKIRRYAGSGLPVITTDIPPLGRELCKRGGALIVDDNPQAVADGVIKLFEDKGLYNWMKENVKRFSRNNLWNNEFKRAFLKMGVAI